MPRPRQYDDDLRVRLLESAALLLAEEGPAAVTTRRVAAEVGTSTSAIYSLLGSKEELLRAMCHEGFARLATHLASVPQTDDPLEDLHRLGRAYHAMAIESPRFYVTMFGQAIPEDALDDAEIEFSLSTLQVLVDAVQRCIDAGLLRGEAYDLALQLWGMNHGITSLALTGTMGDAAEARHRLDHASRAMVAGLQAIDPPKAPPTKRVSRARATRAPASPRR